MKQKSKKKNYNVIKCNTPAKKYEKRKPIKILKCHKKNVLLIAKKSDLTNSLKKSSSRS